MAILNVGNTMAEFAGVTFVETDSARFNSAYSSYAVGKSLLAQDAPNPIDVRFPTPSSDLWIHFTLFTPDWGFAGNVGGYWFQIRDINDMPIAGVDVLALNWHVEAYGATDVAGSNFGMPRLTLMDVDIRVVHGPVNRMELYINGGLMSSAEVANNGQGAPARLYMDHDRMLGSFAQNMAYSELIITDGEPTLGWKLATSDPDSPGFYSDWAGSVADIANQDMATFVTSNSPNQRFSWTPSAYAGPASAAGIRAVCAKAVAQRGVVGPQNMRQFLRIASTDYDGPSTSPTGNQQIGELAVWDENPNTLASWATADLASVEVGVLSEV